MRTWATEDPIQETNTLPRIDLLEDQHGPYGLWDRAQEEDPPDTPEWMRGPHASRLPYVFRRPEHQLTLPGIEPQGLALPRDCAFHTLPANPKLMGSTFEWGLANHLHHAMVKDHGINPAYDVKAFTPEQRRHFFAARARARRIVNGLLKRLYAALPADRLKLVRRYPVSARARLYLACDRYGERAAQLMDTFPVLAVALYASSARITAPALPESVRTMVVAGRPLPEVAREAGIPWSLRAVKPSVAPLVLEEALALNPDLLSYIDRLPSTLIAQKRWLGAMTNGRAGNKAYLEWLSRNALAMGRTKADIVRHVQDVGDWVETCAWNDILDKYGPDVVRTIVEKSGALRTRDRPYVASPLIGRRFNPRMSPQTVLRLSDEWHEATALSTHDGKPITFPEPWYPGEGRIVPITTSTQLFAAGRRLRNCAANYVSKIADGHAYLYTVEEDGKPEAMFELIRGMDGASVSQIRGPFNGEASASVQREIKRWHAKSRKQHGAHPKARPICSGMLPFPDAEDRPF